MFYSIRHVTRFRYSGPVRESDPVQATASEVLILPPAKQKK